MPLWEMFSGGVAECFAHRRAFNCFGWAFTKVALVVYRKASEMCETAI